MNNGNIKVAHDACDVTEIHGAARQTREQYIPCLHKIYVFA